VDTQAFEERELAWKIFMMSKCPKLMRGLSASLEYLMVRFFFS